MSEAGSEEGVEGAAPVTFHPQSELHFWSANGVPTPKYSAPAGWYRG